PRSSLSAGLRCWGEISSISNPRFGVDRTFAQLMKRIMEFFDADTCVLLQPDKERTQWARAVGFSRRSFKWCTRLSGVHRDQGSSAGAGAFLTSIYTTNRYIGGRHPKYLISDPEAPVTVERPVSEASVWQEWLRDDGVRMRHDYFRAGRHL